MEPVQALIGCGYTVRARDGRVRMIEQHNYRFIDNRGRFLAVSLDRFIIAAHRDSLKVKETTVISNLTTPTEFYTAAKKYTTSKNT